MAEDIEDVVDGNDAFLSGNETGLNGKRCCELVVNFPLLFAPVM